MDRAAYDPFARGRFSVGVRTLHARDTARDRLFPCEIWYPAHVMDSDEPTGANAERDSAARPGAHPLVVYCHSSGGDRRSATFLCTHLASHGYVVAALDHSEVIAESLARRDGETQAELAARVDAVIAARVPDVRFLLDFLLGTETSGENGATDIRLDPERVGLVGHSFGGWTVLATTEVEPRVQSVVAMAAGGSARPLPGILPLTLTLAWDRDVPVLYLAGEQDTMIPPDRVIELYERTPGSKRMFILRRADHQHFVDDVEGEHEALRAMSLPGEGAWIPKAMRPIAELCSGEQAHIFVRGLTLGHLDATLRGMHAAERFLAGDVEGDLAARGVEATAHPG